MPLRRKTAAPVPQPSPPPPIRQIVASAAPVRMPGTGLPPMPTDDESLQKELWRLYDCIGEFQFLSDWTGSNTSRARLFVADVDSRGNIQQETSKPDIAELAHAPFGGALGQREALRMLAINLTVTGEAYIVVRGSLQGTARDDEWWIVSRQELRREAAGGAGRWTGGLEVVKDSEWIKVEPERDLVWRVWRPHPRDRVRCTAASYGALPAMLLMEKLTKYSFAQLDSRLVSAGLLTIPNTLDFPDTDGDGRSDSLMKMLVEAGSQSLRGEGTAAGVLPTIIDGPPEDLAAIRLVSFSSELSAHAKDMLDAAIRRFALAMSAPPEVLFGSGDTNHWSMWGIEEGAVKTHIEPVLNLICDALTSRYLRPMLARMGVKDPKSYALWYDTSGLTVRPQRLTDTLNLYEKGIVSADAVRRYGDYRETDAPKDEETARRFVQELLLRDSNLFAQAPIRELAGITEKLLPGFEMPSDQPGAGPPPPPAPPTGIMETGEATPVPQETTIPGAPIDNVVPARTAAAAPADPRSDVLFAVANASALRALEVAGKRLLTRENRGQFASVPPELLHTHIMAGVKAERTLDGAFDLLPQAMGAVGDDRAGQVREVLHQYCLTLITHQHPHEPANLAASLQAAGLI